LIAESLTQWHVTAGIIWRRNNYVDHNTGFRAGCTRCFRKTSKRRLPVYIWFFWKKKKNINSRETLDDLLNENTCNIIICPQQLRIKFIIVSIVTLTSGFSRATLLEGSAYLYFVITQNTPVQPVLFTVDSVWLRIGGHHTKTHF